MKYVILEKEGEPIPLILLTLGPLSHLEIAAAFMPDWKPKSAGYYNPAKGEAIGFSQSLNLGPAYGDGSIIFAFTQSTLLTATPRPPAEVSVSDAKRFLMGESRDHLTNTFTGRP